MKYPAVSKVMNFYLNETRLSVRKAATALSVEEPITHGSVQNWKKGLYRPDLSWLISLLATTGPDDLRHRFATAMIEAVKPGYLKYTENLSAVTSVKNTDITTEKQQEETNVP